ncbi:MAG: Fe-S protein assembly chaperone HscA, partial [Proteobacteria bacterium]
VEERTELESVAGELVSVIEGDDIEIIRERTDVLGQASLAFAERRMDRSIKSALSGVAVSELEAPE